MEDSTQLGMNRTGIQLSPRMSKAMQEGIEELQPKNFPPEAESLATTRVAYIKEAKSVGSVPIPATIKGAGKSGLELLKGHRPQTFIDKIGERLAFERSGVRLYDALIVKCEASEMVDELPIDELKSYRAQEASHFAILCKVMENLGADPTAMTPCADVSGVAGMGLIQVISDSRTTVAQSLSAILVAELTDNEGWDVLIDLARAAGHEDLVAQFQMAHGHEQVHLEGIRRLLKRLMEKDEALLQ